ncbi:MAG: 1,4-alpha-glucan branching protein GlgB [Oscillospiraceae bacterium]|nr:1,4-alpha-glucan branching protein GlgB [Oscillospiraceae bacterium]
MDQRHQAFIPKDDIYLFNTGHARKAWLCFGCRWIPELEEFRFIVWAPNAQKVSLIGDFNGWNDTPMERQEGGVWACFVDNAVVGHHYKYRVVGADGKTVLKSDPFAAWSENRSETASIVWDGGHFIWQDQRFMEQRSRQNFMTTPMSIYELHLGSWMYPDGGVNYRSIGDALAAYCSDMGYTHVELMPVTEYPYDGSWGYQVTGYYAPTSRYGTPDDFRYFVDTLHRAGIGVIMDWVPAHFPKDEHGLRLFDGTPLYECKEQRMAEHPEWGTLIFDYSSDQVQSFLISSACLFFDEYHIDGIRVDAVSSMLYLNYGRKEGEYTPNKDGGYINLNALDFLRNMNSAVLSNYPGAVTIAEESTAYPLITAPPDVGGVGFCLKWDMGFMHDTLDYMALDPYFRAWNHNKLTFSMMYAFSENYVLAYSHDEVVHGKYSMINKMSGDYDQKFASVRTLYGYQFSHPGKKLTFMGSEFGQFIEWNWQQSLDWLLLDYPRHRELQAYMRALNHLYREHPALYLQDRSWDGFQWLNVDDSQRSSIAYMRIPGDGSRSMVCVFNFTPVQYDGFVFGLPQNGTLKEILNSDETRFGGHGVTNPAAIRAKKQPFVEHPWSASITLPALSAVFFEFRPVSPRKKKKTD